MFIYFIFYFKIPFNKFILYNINVKKIIFIFNYKKKGENLYANNHCRTIGIWKKFSCVKQLINAVCDGFDSKYYYNGLYASRGSDCHNQSDNRKDNSEQQAIFFHISSTVIFYNITQFLISENITLATCPALPAFYADILP